MIINQQSVSLDPRNPDFVQNPYAFYAEHIVPPGPSSQGWSAIANVLAKVSSQ